MYSISKCEIFETFDHKWLVNLLTPQAKFMNLTSEGS